MWKRIAAVLFLTLGHATAEAAIHCEGLVHWVLLYSDGTVTVAGSWRGDYTTICNTNGTRGGISAEVCHAWYPVASKAAADGKTLGVYSDTSSYTCANMPTYGSAPNVTYVGLKRQ